MNFKTIAIAALGAMSLSVTNAAVDSFTTPVLAQGFPGETTCGINPAVATYETRNFWIYICREGQGYRYIGVNKTTRQSLSRSAQRSGNGYRAVNGDFTYIIDEQDLLVLQGDLLFSREPVTDVWYAPVANPSREGMLTARDANAQINLRENPSPTARSLGYGLVGDRVTILSQSRGSDNYLWYRVQFPRSRAVGWIRGDFVRLL
jgi:hypothetical protein